jgi:hypothetical protein
VRSSPGWVVFDTSAAPEARLGQLRFTFEGKAMLGTCQSHKACRLALSVKPALQLGLPELECDLTVWLAYGSCVDKDAHEAAGRRLRQDRYQMRLRS